MPPRGAGCGAVPRRGSLAYADLASFPDDHLRREIIDGELIVTPSPVVRMITVRIRLWGPAAALAADLQDQGVSLAPAATQADRPETSTPTPELV